MIERRTYQLPFIGEFTNREHIPEGSEIQPMQPAELLEAMGEPHPGRISMSVAGYDTESGSAMVEIEAEGDFLDKVDQWIAANRCAHCGAVDIEKIRTVAKMAKPVRGKP